MSKLNQIRLQRLRDPDTNPCLQEADLSTSCLEKYHYDKEKCALFFENYNNCKSYWGVILRKRRQAGIVPELPNQKERAKILDEKRKNNHVISAPVDD